MPARIKLLDLNKEEIIEMYDCSGHSMDYIADYFNVSRASISRRLMEWGFTDHWTEIDLDSKTLYDLYYNKKLSEQQIADRHNCSRAMIHRRMVKFGIERRTYSECRRGKLNPFYGKNHTKNSKRKMSLSFVNGRQITGSNKYGVGLYYDTPNQGRKWLRSKWEAKTADYLTHNKKDWYYEYRWLKVGKEYYLPDFYLTGENKYIEVKGFSFEKTANKLKLATEIYNIEIWNREELINRGIINNSGN